MRLIIPQFPPWFNPADIEADEFSLSILDAIAAAGVAPDAEQAEGIQWLGQLALFAPPAQDDVPPLLASLVAARTVAPVDYDWQYVENADGDSQVMPLRRVWQLTHTLPVVDEEFELLHVRYVFPAPDGSGVFLHFATPNLPEQELMEALFDQLTTQVRFADGDLPEETDADAVVLPPPPDQQTDATPAE